MSSHLHPNIRFDLQHSGTFGKYLICCYEPGKKARSTFCWGRNVFNSQQPSRWMSQCCVVCPKRYTRWSQPGPCWTLNWTLLHHLVLKSPQNYFSARIPKPWEVFSITSCQSSTERIIPVIQRGTWCYSLPAGESYSLVAKFRPLRNTHLCTYHVTERKKEISSYCVTVLLETLRTKCI